MTDYFNVKLPDGDIGAISALGLAHLGDGVYELLVRTYLCCHGGATPHGLHNATVSYVSAPAQARAAEKLLPFLSDSELAFYKRGRNAHVNSTPARATLGEYHAASGLESLFGALYLRGETARINELFCMIMDSESEQ